MEKILKYERMYEPKWRGGYADIVAKFRNKEEQDIEPFV